MEKNTRTHTHEARLSAIGGLTFDPATTTGPRRFSGVANSGTPFNYYGEPVVIDFANLQHKPKIPVLFNHSDPAGVAELAVGEAGLTASGSLLDNEFGKAVASASDQGFPWEMSVSVQYATAETLAAGAKAVVNGREITGPVTVWRGCTIREVSFTPVGVDPNTTATALSNTQPKPTTQQKDTPMDTPMDKENVPAPAAGNGNASQIEALKKEIADLKAENAALKKSAKKSETDAKLSAAGFQNAENGGFKGVSAAMYAALLSATDADRDAMIADLKPTEPAKPAAPAALLSDTEAAANDGNSAKLSGLVADADARNTNKGVNYV